MLTCPLVAGKVLCSETDNKTPKLALYSPLNISLTAVMSRIEDYKGNESAAVHICINVCVQQCY